MSTRPADVRKLLPWATLRLPECPFPGMWGFNPSIHFDGTQWRCSLRCADYSLPGGATVRGELASPAYVKNKNVMLELDPGTSRRGNPAHWRVASMAEMTELDGYPRAAGCTYLGYADLRLFFTPRFGLQAIAAAMQLGGSGRKTHRPAEQVLLSLDAGYQIVKAEPIRGGWSGRAQKNWSPFDHAEEPMFLQSVSRGIVFSKDGPLTSNGAMISSLQGGYAGARARSAPTSGSGGPGEYHGLRGGTQLVYIRDMLRSLVGDVDGGVWLSLAHDMRFVQGKKFYWHLFYAVDSIGRMLAQSVPVKLAENGIEFAAGLAVDDDRAIISFGVDDCESWLAETSLSAILELLRPVHASESVRGSLR